MRAKRATSPMHRLSHRTIKGGARIYSIRRAVASVCALGIWTTHIAERLRSTGPSP